MNERKARSYRRQGPVATQLLRLAACLSFLAGLGGGPWKLADAFVAALAAPSPARPGVRAVLVTADPLMRALNRPNREQVVTRRDSLATTLQALELTNGETLASQLTRGATDWLRKHPGDAGAIIEKIYARALGRAPNNVEVAVAADLVGMVVQNIGAIN